MLFYPEIDTWEWFRRLTPLVLLIQSSAAPLSLLTALNNDVPFCFATSLLIFRIINPNLIKEKRRNMICDRYWSTSEVQLVHPTKDPSIFSMRNRMFYSHFCSIKNLLMWLLFTGFLIVKKGCCSFFPFALKRKGCFRSTLKVIIIFEKWFWIFAPKITIAVEFWQYN